MNCKQGDLALVREPFAHCDNGKIVRVVEPGDDWKHLGDTRFHWACDTLGQRSAFDNSQGLSDGIELVDVPDACLVPLRGGDGEDEVLRLVGRPVGAPQAA